MGRFICPDPIGSDGGLNLGSYAPNPLAWIDPWGWCKKGDQVKINSAKGKAHEDAVTQAAIDKYGKDKVKNEVYIRPHDANGNPVNYRVRADNTIGSPKNPDVIIEAKGSNSAPLSKNQKKGYPLIEKNGGTIEVGSGKNKIKIPIPATEVKIIRPNGMENI